MRIWMMTMMKKNLMTKKTRYSFSSIFLFFNFGEVFVWKPFWKVYFQYIYIITFYFHIMGWKIALSLLFFIIAVSLLITYWFIPINTTEFKIAAGYYGSNFENLTSESLQFYPNMRFPESKISYRVEMCSLQEQNYIDNAFDSLSSFTILSFYKVSSN